MKKSIIVFLLIFPIFSPLCGQGQTFSEFTYPRFARVIGMGGVHAGVANRIESVYYNSAGLAELDNISLIYSNGGGLIPFLNQDQNDCAIAVPFNKMAVAFSLNRFGYVQDDYAEGNSSLYRLHFARMINSNFSVGLSFDYYDESGQSTLVAGTKAEYEGSSYDFSLSTLYNLNRIHLVRNNDQFRFGFQFQNLFNTKTTYKGRTQEDIKFQMMRVGLSYYLIPSSESPDDIDPFKFLFGFDAIFIMADYEFNLWRPNFGFELTIYEYFFFRYGRENELELREYYGGNLNYPVNRYGLGFRLPISQLLKMKNELNFQIDYCISDWGDVVESEVFGFGTSDIDQDAVSIQVDFSLD